MHTTCIPLPTHLKPCFIGRHFVPPDRDRWLSYDLYDRSTWPNMGIIFGWMLSGETAEVPSFFDQITVGWETDVSHGKITNLPTIVDNGRVTGVPEGYEAPMYFVTGIETVTWTSGSYSPQSSKHFVKYRSLPDQGISEDYSGSIGVNQYGWMFEVTYHGYQCKWEDGRLFYRYTVTQYWEYVSDDPSSPCPIPAPHTADLPQERSSYTSDWYESYYYPDIYLTDWEMPPLFPGMHFNEPQFIRGYGPVPEVVNDVMKYAIVDSLHDIPAIADNNIANAIDIFNLVRDACFGKWGNIIPTTLRDLWMFWRYCFSTTKSDVKQALDYLSKQHVRYYSDMKVYGTATTGALEYGIDSITCRVTYKIRKQTADIAAVLRNQLHESGLEMTPYTLWDLVPFSFVVDWFIPVGDRLKLRDDIQHFEVDYLVSGTTWSLSYDYNHSTDYQSHHYSRWHGGIPALDGVQLPSGRTSMTTIAKRAVDTICLVH